MSGIALKDLTKYHQRAMQYFKNGLVSEQNRLYAQTEEAGAVSFWPLGGTPLEGKVKFSFKETSPASGDKGPENPSTIAGVSNVSVTSCGLNLFNVRGTLLQASAYSITEDDFLVLSGTNSSSSTRYFGHHLAFSPVIQSDKTYTVVIEVQSISNCSIQFGMNSRYAQRGQLNTGRWVEYSSVGTFFRTCSNNNIYNPNTMLRLIIGAVANSSYSVKMRVSVFEGSVDATNFEYEPYIGNDYTIQLGNTYYGGEIDLATGVMTLTKIGKVFTGGESWQMHSTSTSEKSVFQLLNCFPAGNLDSIPVCTHIPYDYSQSLPLCFTWYTSTGTVRLSVDANDFPTLSSFKNWLEQQYNNGTPMTIVGGFPKAYGSQEQVSPLVQLTPLQLTALAQKDKYTPRMNTVYTDADSIQIRYRKSLIHDEDEKVQAITALGGNV